MCRWSGVRFGLAGDGGMTRVAGSRLLMGDAVCWLRSHLPGFGRRREWVRAGRNILKERRQHSACQNTPRQIDSGTETYVM